MPGQGESGMRGWRCVPLCKGHGHDSLLMAALSQRWQLDRRAPRRFSILAGGAAQDRCDWRTDALAKRELRCLAAGPTGAGAPVRGPIQAPHAAPGPAHYRFLDQPGALEMVRLKQKPLTLGVRSLQDPQLAGSHEAQALLHMLHRRPEEACRTLGEADAWSPDLLSAAVAAGE